MLSLESDLDSDTSVSKREISVEMDLTKLNKGWDLRDGPSWDSISVERDFTKLIEGLGLCEYPRLVAL